MEAKEYYVYAHLRSSDGSLFYIGKGSGHRAYRTNGRNLHWNNIFNKHGRKVVILKRFSSEVCALSYESAMISSVISDRMANKSSGGIKNSGWKHSQEWKEKASAQRSGPSNPNYGKKMSEDQRRAISKSLTGRASPKKGRPSNHDSVSQASAMRELWRLGTDGPFGHILHTDGYKNRRRTEKAVSTKCGMKFSGMSEACRWLSKNGWPKASHAAISYSCNNDGSKRYGFEWRYDDE